jgi:hypothetical protein
MSYLASTSLLNDIAQLRAITSAPIINNSCLISGIPPAAIKALITANGNEKIVCENFISLKMVKSLKSLLCSCFTVSSLFLMLFMMNIGLHGLINVYNMMIYCYTTGMITCMEKFTNIFGTFCPTIRTKLSIISFI